MKDMQEKESNMGVRGIDRKIRPSHSLASLGTASIMMPDSDPQDRFFYLPLAP